MVACDPACRACAALAPGMQAVQSVHMAVAPIIAESFAPLVDLLFPPRCPLCG